MTAHTILTESEMIRSSSNLLCQYDCNEYMTASYARSGTEAHTVMLTMTSREAYGRTKCVILSEAQARELAAKLINLADSYKSAERQDR